MKKYLISFGDERYNNRRIYFKESALQAQFFDDIRVFSPADIDDEFYTQIYAPVQSLRGGGFWLWKPYLIKKMFDQIDEGDVLIYSDAGCTINPLGKKRFEEYMGMLAEGNIDSIDFQLEFKEFQYTKQEVFNYFESSGEVINANQLMATVLVLKKTARTMMLIDIWYGTAIHQPILFTDLQTVVQKPEFLDHRHDQSIFSVIRNTHGANIIPDETYFLDFIREGSAFPFWATRFRG